MTRFLKSVAIITAATIGSGEFALPFIFYRAGWLLTLGWFALLGALIVAAHAIYFKTLERTGERERLLGLARRYLGTGGFWIGFAAIVVGLLLSFVIFLILGTQFLLLLFPRLSYLAALFCFWLIIAIPALVSNRRAVALERVSVTLTAAIIVVVFILSFWPGGAEVGVVGGGVSTGSIALARTIPLVDWRNLFLPFGVVLFALTGWPGVEPLYESLKGSLQNKKASNEKVPAGLPIAWLLAAGTAAAALLYILFAAAILHAAPAITTDTISGIAAWPAWEKGLVALLGLVAIGTCSMPISHEIRNALEEDLRWSGAASRLVIIGLPLAAVLAGFNNFLAVVGLTGGVFLSTQYLLIVAVGRRALALSPMQRFLLDAIALVFAAVAVYSMVAFVVH